MSFQITGLDGARFSHLYGLSEAALREHGVERKRVDANPGYPCRITLEDPDLDETVLLLNFESHAVSTPYQSQYAIYVREGALAAPTFVDALPPVMAARPIAMRLFDEAGYLVGADFFMGDEGQAKIEAALSRPEVAYIHAHNAMHGCFVAEIKAV